MFGALRKLLGFQDHPQQQANPGPAGPDPRLAGQHQPLAVQPSNTGFQGGADAMGHNRDMARELAPQRNPQRAWMQQGPGVQGGAGAVPYSWQLGDFGIDDNRTIQGGGFDEANMNQEPLKRILGRY